LCRPFGSPFDVRASDFSRRDWQKRDDEAIGRTYRPIPKSHFPFSVSILPEGAEKGAPWRLDDIRPDFLIASYRKRIAITFEANGERLN
jgi:hypothetical protein